MVVCDCVVIWSNDLFILLPDSKYLYFRYLYLIYSIVSVSVSLTLTPIYAISRSFERRFQHLQQHGFLSKSGRTELLFQDSHAERFFLLDGDSLLLDASLSQTWQKGQQLHLFYIVELALKRFRDHGGVFRIVFFEDFKRHWTFSPLFSFYRQALILHLKTQCDLHVYTEWTNAFDSSWKEFVDQEKPEFLCLHSGLVEDNPGLAAGLNVMAYCASGANIPLVILDSVFREKTHLYGAHISSSKRQQWSFQLMRTFLIKLHEISLPDVEVDELNFDSTPGLHLEEGANVAQFMEQLFISCLKFAQNNGLAQDNQRIQQWCLYFAVMSEKSLEKRLSFAPERQNLRHEEELNAMVQIISKVILRSGCNKSVGSFVSDLVDSAVLDAILEKDSHEISLEVSDTFSKFFQQAGQAEDCTFAFREGAPTVPIEEICTPKFPPFKGTIIDSFAGEIMQKFEKAEVLSGGLDEEPYEETYHWHALKELRDADEEMNKPIPSNAKAKEKHIRNGQKYGEYMKSYGTSLNDKREPKTIITQKVSKSNKKKSLPPEVLNESKNATAKQSSKKSLQKSKKDIIIEQNIKSKQDVEVQKQKDKWSFFHKKIESMHSDAKIGELEKLIQLDLQIQHQEPHQLYLSLLFDKWKEGRSLKDAAILVKELQKYVELGDNLASARPLSKDVVRLFLKLGFEDMGRGLHAKFRADQPMPSVKTKDVCHIGCSYQDFQMGHMGHLMTRSVRSDPDPRVEGFIPDTWQRELLDAVDKNESALIVAPTSSGKTFCSYYCIEKVISESDDGIVVYVAPTKALVNQVSASVFAKFNKTCPPGKFLCGVFTRDYKQNAENCQVLVTVPQCLEILLLSPKRQAWSSNLKYVILDEVHCLGGENGGEVWEHILSMIRCPFLALSATIGDPEYFHGWVRSLAEYKSKTGDRLSSVVRFVHHSERYSDIEMSLFDETSNALKPVHPVGYLDSNLLAKKGFPESLKLSSSESSTLWSAALSSKGLFPEDISKLKALDPKHYFQADVSIAKPDARAYEVKLKKTLEEIMMEKSYKDRCELTKSLKSEIMVNNTHCYAQSGLEEGERLKFFPKLISLMQDEDKLPVIVFLCDRAGIETLAKQLYREISSMMISDKTLKEMGDKLEKLKQKKEEFERNRRDKNKEGMDKKPPKVSESEMTVAEEYNRSFLQYKMRLSRYILGNLGDDDSVSTIIEGASKWMQTLLKYGVGYHHAGCSKKDRQAVEILFRMGKIKVVIATATLALGIHMPCKAVVFVGNDYYVDALGFRQMSGRSGRRGFDNVGNVIFFGVPSVKISRLIEANITQLKGRHPLSISFILRLLLLMNGAKDKDDARLKVLSALENPFIGYNSPANQYQIKLHFLFSCNVLFQQRLIDLEGKPMGYSGLVTHLHYHEPGNIFLVRLLQEETLEDFCTEAINIPTDDDYSRYECTSCKKNLLRVPRYKCQVCSWENCLCSSCYNRHEGHGHPKNRHEKNEFQLLEPLQAALYTEDTLRNLVLILCHLFCNRLISPTRITEGRNGRELLRKPKCGSKVLLEELPSSVASVVESLNREILGSFRNFLRGVTYSSYNTIMPCSKNSVIDAEEGSNLSGISPIARLSGCVNSDIENQEFSPGDFDRLLPQDFLYKGSLPFINMNRAKDAYALDFFKHGSKSALLEDNGLKSGEVYDSVNDFLLTVRSIANALDQIPDHRFVTEAFKHLAIVFELRFNKVFRRSER